jgi:hypothetical protein
MHTVPEAFSSHYKWVHMVSDKCKLLTGPELHVELSRVALFSGLLIRDLHRSQFNLSDPDGPPQYDLPKFVNDSILSVNDIHDRLMPQCIVLYQLAKSYQKGQGNLANNAAGPSRISTVHNYLQDGPHISSTTPEVTHDTPEVRKSWRKRSRETGGDADGPHTTPTKARHQKQQPTQPELNSTISKRPQRERRAPVRSDPGAEGTAKVQKVGRKGKGKMAEVIEEEPEDDMLPEVRKTLRFVHLYCSFF